MLSSFLTSLGLIFLAELGDKTNFLVFYLASRYRLKLVVLPIFSAIAVLEAMAVFFGTFLRNSFFPWFSHLLSGVVFLVAFFWFWRESYQKNEQSYPVEELNSSTSTFRVFIVIFSSFLLAELGDKTQFGTFALATRFDQSLMVLLGGIMGMFLPNFIVSLLGEKIAHLPHIKIFRKLGAFLFLLFAIVSFYQFLHLILG